MVQYLSESTYIIDRSSLGVWKKHRLREKTGKNEYYTLNNKKGEENLLLRDFWAISYFFMQEAFFNALPARIRPQSSCFAFGFYFMQLDIKINFYLWFTNTHVVQL